VIPEAEVDVTVIGGGPAGAAAALTLLRYTSLHVALIERTRFEEARLGEALPPGVAPLLTYLDAGRVLDASTHLQARGTAASWGSPDVVSRDFLFAGRGKGWHLDRGQFDRSLASLVGERGGEAMLGTILVSDTRVAGRWRLRLRNAAGVCDVSTRFVIDASGRRAAFARRRGARRTIDDPLFGVVGRLSSSSAQTFDSQILVESCPAGWWYSALVPGDCMVAVLMTDAATIRRHRLHTPNGWLEHLDLTDHTRQRTADRVLAERPFVCPAFSQILNPMAGDGWIAAGDAAVGFDPLSSMGIGYALSSGIHAARAAADALEGSDARLREYAGHVRAHYDAYWTRRCKYYALERRWLDAPFWTRRSAG
jgi:flavin-dependent dehydrogenase